MKKVILPFLLCYIFAVFFLPGCDPSGTNGCDDSVPNDADGIRPIVFVHGMAGSGDQFQAQALRFASNGYPEDYFTGFDHNTVSDPGRQQRLDTTIDEVLQKTGADKVDLVGHSMGTGISQKYLSDPSHAAKVAHYVNVDGNGASDLPGGVPTLNIIATISGEITNAENIRLENNTHVQAVSSPEVFAHMYNFFTSQEPETTEILPSSSGTITLKGRIVNFISNTVPKNGTVSIYEVDADTGRRLSSQPVYTKATGTDGSFNFTTAKQGGSYEFTATLLNEDQVGHWYYEPFVRTDTMIRLKYTEPGSMLFNMMDSSPSASCVIIVRNREMLGSNQGGAGVDSIKINDDEVCEGILPGAAGVNSGPMGLLIFDVDADGKSDLSSVGGPFQLIPFVNSVDLVIPAAESADGTISIVEKDRYSGKTQKINIPNYPSSTHKTFIQFLPH